MIREYPLEMGKWQWLMAQWLMTLNWYEGMPRPGTRVWVMVFGECRVQGVITAIDHLGMAPAALVALRLEGMEEGEPLYMTFLRDEMEIISAA